VAIPLYEAKADMFKKLSHPARIRILELLCEREHAVHELLAEIDIEASNLSQQLAVLRSSGLVHSRRDRSEVFYSLSISEVRDLLLAGRRILGSLLESQDRERSELRGELSSARNVISEGAS
jgi:DNA-binding transcriptional ArsR family regulator